MGVIWILILLKNSPFVISFNIKNTLYRMHAIGHIETENYDKANEMLGKSYSLYVKEPFNVKFYIWIFW